MRKQLTRAILVTGTVAAAVGLAVPAAMAAGTWTVTGGQNFTSAQASGATFKLADGSNSFTCTVASGSGSVKDQSMSTNTQIGSITAASFSSCSGSFSSKGSDSQKAGTVSTLNVSSFSAPVTTGTITGVDHILTITSPISCSTEVQGTAGVTYNNNTHELNFTTAGDNLTVVGTGCNGIINQGTHPTFSSSGGGEVVTGSPTNPIQISQP